MIWGSFWGGRNALMVGPASLTPSLFELRRTSWPVEFSERSVCHVSFHEAQTGGIEIKTGHPACLRTEFLEAECRSGGNGLLHASAGADQGIDLAQGETRRPQRPADCFCSQGGRCLALSGKVSAEHNGNCFNRSLTVV